MLAKTDLLERELMDGILHGKYPPGSKLPSRHKLMQSFACSRTTVERAVERLTRAGYLNGERGSGTYVLTNSMEHPLRELRVVTPIFENRPAPEAMLFPNELEGMTVRLFSPAQARAKTNLLTAPGGAVLWVMPGEEQILLMDILADCGIPQLLQNRDYRKYDCIITDYANSLREGLSWLMIESGREIAFCAHNPSTIRPFQSERIIEFFKNSINLGAKLDSDHVVLRDFTDVPGEISEITTAWFTKRKIPKGIFILDKELAMPFVVCARNHGLTAGKDFRLLLFDYEPELSNLPGIAMMEQPYQQFREEVLPWLKIAEKGTHPRYEKRLKTDLHICQEG